MLKRVYVFEYDGKFKIGVSGNTKRRKMDLLVGCPGIESLYESDYLSNAFYVENMLHKLFSDYSIGGEWFSSIDMEKIKNIVNTLGCLEEKIPEKTTQNENKDQKFEIYFKEKDGELKTADDIENELKEMREENIQLEKFALAAEGIDVPNIYSDLIYEVLFGTDTQGMIEKYKKNRFESFRKNLTDEQNKKIDDLMSLIGGLINYYWKFPQIEEFIKTKINTNNTSAKND